MTKPATTTDLEVSLETLAEMGTANLARVIAIDSQSDERSDTIPSTEGQRRLSEDLSGFFANLGLKTSIDDFANLLVEIPATPGVNVPKIALLIHMDTARGTLATDALQQQPNWQGDRIPYPENDRLEVSAERYEETQSYIGEDIIFGPGKFPIGLDDKLGLSEMMTLAQVLTKQPSAAHGEIVLVCRPDEEIGRMAAVEGLAKTLAERGIAYGYTLDGIGPFEIQTENFDASRGRGTVAGKKLQLNDDEVGHRLTLRIEGCNSHGATAKPEGYLNATIILTRAWQTLKNRGDIIPTRFATNATCEVNGDVEFLLKAPKGKDATAAIEEVQAVLIKTLESLTTPHAWRGARITEVKRQDTPVQPSDIGTDAVVTLLEGINTLLDADGPKPVLSEESEGRQGYTNAFDITSGDTGANIEFRIRAFGEEELEARAQTLCKVFDGHGIAIEVDRQYRNMGPALAPHPELTRWAEQAAARIDVECNVCPIRGGTGVDPFLDRGIPIANLGTGYFAPESEKELTSRQKIAQHTLWLWHVVQLVGRG